MKRRFWKWTMTIVAGVWFGGLGLLALDLVPALWVAFITLPGMFSGSIVPALWAGDDLDNNDTKKTAL
jgi:hypothetical protein